MNRRTLLLMGGATLVSGCGARIIAPSEPTWPSVDEITTKLIHDPNFDPINPDYGPYQVSFTDTEYGSAVGDMLVSTTRRILLFRNTENTAILYPVGVGTVAQQWTGTEIVTRKAVNPRWTPTPAMIARDPDTYGRYRNGVPGGAENNPLGVRALYLGSTYYRIHGTNNPARIGRFVSNGCINMHNNHVIYLYEQVAVGAKVIVV